MLKVDTEKISALIEEEKGKLLNISLVNDQQQNTIKRILSNIFRNPVVEQSSKNHQQYGISYEYYR